MKKLFQIALISLSVAVTALRANAYENDCCNDCQPAPGCSPVGANPIHAGMANLHREVTDLTTDGAAPIAFTRIFNSRTTNFNDPYWDFGARQTWQHNWNYEVRQLTTKTFNQFDIKVRYPDGLEYNFKATSTTGNQFVPPADCGDRLYKWSGSTVGYTLITPEGKEYDFWRYLSPKFHLTELRDGQGLKWTFTYNSDTTLKRITNIFGRWIELERTSVSGVLCITRVFSNDGRQVTYSYSPWTPTGSIVLTMVTYPGAEQAQYTWATADPTVPTARPLLETASDPLYPGSGSRIRYVFNYDARFNYGAGPYLVTGMVKEERNLDTNSEIVSLPLGGGHYPQILDGDDTEITRKFLYGSVTESRDGENRQTLFTYATDGFGYLASTTEPNGAVTAYSRDYAGRIVTRTDSLGHTKSFTYNPAGFEVSRTNERNYTTTTTRDTGNRPVRIDYPDSTYETWSYNTYGQELIHRGRSGGIVTSAYYNGIEVGGKLGDLKSRTDALGGISAFTYTSSGLRATSRDPGNHLVSYGYDWRSNVVSVTHSDGTVDHSEYDSSGNRTSYIDELGHAWAYTYDEFNHLVSTTDPLGRTTANEYGRDPGCTTCAFSEALTRVTLPSGKKTEYAYDRSGKPTSQIFGAGSAVAATVMFTYTPQGDLGAITDARGKSTNFTYDALHRRTSMMDPMGQTTLYEYDAAGNKISETRPDGGITAFVYDSMNRLTQTTDPTGAVTQLAYSGENNLIRVTDARGNNYTFEYDLDNQKTKMIYPDQSFEQWTFDVDGNMASFRTRSGQIKTLTYDARERRTLANWSDSTPDVTTTYDSAGRVLSMTSSVSVLSFTYDDSGRMISEAQQIMSDGGPKSVTYSYDPDGLRTSIGYPSGSVASLSYDARHQLTALSSNGISAGYTFDSNGNRIGKVLGNNTTAEYTFDDGNRLTTVDQQKLGTSFLKLDYEYNAVNGRTAQTAREGGPSTAVRVENYGYDALGQAINVEYRSGNPLATDRAVAYNYDPAGNRSSVTDNGVGTAYVVNQLNQYTAVDGEAPTYDAMGNLKTHGGWTYTYDAQNRLVSALSSQSSVLFAYDPRNRCVNRTVNGVTTFFYYDGWRLIEEQDAGSTLIARYVNGAETDDIIARATPAAVSYYHTDGLGSTRALTDALGNVVERYTYDVFGLPAIKDAAGSILSSSALGNRFLFAEGDLCLLSAFMTNATASIRPNWEDSSNLIPVDSREPTIIYILMSLTIRLASKIHLASWLGTSPRIGPIRNIPTYQERPA